MGGKRQKNEDGGARRGGCGCPPASWVHRRRGARQSIQGYGLRMQYSGKAGQGELAGRGGQPPARTASAHRAPRTRPGAGVAGAAVADTQHVSSRL